MKIKMIYDVVIIGAGASGLMAASRIKKGSVALIDGNSKIGAKIEVSGGGKCNVTNENVGTEHFDGDKDLLAKVFKKFDNQALLRLLKKSGVVPTKQNRVVKNQYFCQSSKEVITYFRKQTSQCKLMLNEKVTSVEKNSHFEIKTDRKTITAHNLIIASGGISFEQLGASDIGYTIARKFGHTVTKSDPALVGFTVLPDQRWFKDLSGLSASVKVTVGEKEIDGNLLFAHKGVTGPAMMVASLYWRKGKMTIDFIPKTSIQKLFKGNENRNTSTALPLPKRLTKAFLSSISLSDKPLKSLSKEEKEKLCQIKAYEFSPAGNFGFKRAEVTRGGVSTDDINPDTLESNLEKGLFFTGEVLDITGELGGYNLQWAFSSGFVCGNYVNGIIG